MKCAQCFDYNRGVKAGECIACGHNRFDDAAAVELTDDTLDLLSLQLEKTLQLNHSWTEIEERENATNVEAINLLCKKLFGGNAFVSKEGSVAKMTAINTSDVDLMVSMRSKSEEAAKPASELQLQELVDALQQHPRFESATFAKVACKVCGVHLCVKPRFPNQMQHLFFYERKVVPLRGADIDIVFRRNSFTLSYLQPACRGIRHRPAVVSHSSVACFLARINQPTFLAPLDYSGQSF